MSISLNSAPGGNGIAAALLVLQKLAAANTAGLPALLVWCCKHAGHFELMAPRVLAMAQALGLNLSMKFYYTGAAGRVCVTYVFWEYV